MGREDKFIRLLDFGDGPVAEFEHAYPVYYAYDSYYTGGPTRRILKTHFRLNRKSLLTRIENLKLPKNYGKVPWSMVQENAALAAMDC